MQGRDGAVDHGRGLSECVNVMGISVHVREYVTCFTLGTRVLRCEPTETKNRLRCPDDSAVSMLKINS